MFCRARDLDAETDIEADICIVGAGPAGITLARALARHDPRRRVLLVEAGNPDGPGPAQDLYRGDTSHPAFHQPPHTDRTRGLGGTSALWGGRCMPYDPSDFAPRPAGQVPGWPIAFDDLLPYYRAAQREAECGDWAYDAVTAGLDGAMIDGAATDALHLDSLERWSPPTHFGKAHRDELRQSVTITVLFGAVATGMTHRDGRVTRLALRDLRGGRALHVRAGRFVLAGGGLEVPRLLMHTQAGTGTALGDHSGWLGRGYMCHVGGVIARVVLTPGRPVVFGYEQDQAGVYLRRRLTLGAAARQAQGLPNLYMLLDRPLLDDAGHNSAILSLTYLAKRMFQPQSRTAPPEGRFAHYRSHLRNLLFGAPEVLSVLPRFGRARLLAGRRVPSLLLRSRDNSFHLYFHAEQEPLRDSRLTLGPDWDGAGMARLRIDARLSDRDADGIVKAHGVVGAELERTGAGRLEFLGADPAALVAACKCTLGHHIGAARMAARPEDGVVDPDGQVFGIDNLFVASAAMLPTSSQAHPTLTVVALALRLAERLDRK
jgi:choline dehydrogenase-like flavoprotein